MITEQDRLDRQAKLNRLTLFYEERKEQVNPLKEEGLADLPPVSKGSSENDTTSPKFLVDESLLEDPLVETVLKAKIKQPKNSLMDKVQKTVDRSWRQSLELWKEQTMSMPSVALAMGFMARLG